LEVEVFTTRPETRSPREVVHGDRIVTRIGKASGESFVEGVKATHIRQDDDTQAGLRCLCQRGGHQCPITGPQLETVSSPTASRLMDTFLRQLRRHGIDPKTHHRLPSKKTARAREGATVEMAERAEPPTEAAP
jgi:DNA-binding LacI/PurR family transcriptional regulator